MEYTTEEIKDRIERFKSGERGLIECKDDCENFAWDGRFSIYMKAELKKMGATERIQEMKGWELIYYWFACGRHHPACEGRKMQAEHKEAVEEMPHEDEQQKYEHTDALVPEPYYPEAKMWIHSMENRGWKLETSHVLPHPEYTKPVLHLWFSRPVTAATTGYMEAKKKPIQKKKAYGKKK